MFRRHSVPLPFHPCFRASAAASFATPRSSSVAVPASSFATAVARAIVSQRRASSALPSAAAPPSAASPRHAFASSSWFSAQKPGSRRSAASRWPYASA